MSTNNFKYENILVELPDFHYHDGEEVDFDYFMYDGWVSEVQNQLVKIGFDTMDKWNRDNNYGGTIIARYGLEDRTGMIKYLEVVVRSGYYDGANIDYTIDGDFDDKHAKSLDKKFNSMIKKTEKILRANGTELLKVAQFSNGEAVYKVKK